MLLQNANFRLLSLVLGTWIASVITPVEAKAQRAPKADEVLARLEQGDIRSINIRSAFETQGNYRQYTDADGTNSSTLSSGLPAEGLIKAPGVQPSWSSASSADHHHTAWRRRPGRCQGACCGSTNRRR